MKISVDISCESFSLKKKKKNPKYCLLQILHGAWEMFWSTGETRENTLMGRIVNRIYLPLFASHSIDFYTKFSTILMFEVHY